ncbi:T cell receptor alpha variable 17 [Camelus dromedarius]|nr:T cell receptor alpha variable 17 [Camelus dromedarius]
MEKFLTVSLVILWLQPARVSSQQGEQNLPALIVQEGENAILHCSYSTALSSSHWYRQDPRRGFTHLILTRSNEKEKPGGRLRATLCTSVRSSSLLITASQAADTYLCETGAQGSVGICSPNTTLSLRSPSSILPLYTPSRKEQGSFSAYNMLSVSHLLLVIFLLYRGTSGDSVTQTEVPVTLSERELLMLNCTYQTTDSDPYLFWYVQYVNKAPQLLLKGSAANPRPEHQGFQATLVKSSRTFHLQKPSVQTSDSAVYYCALRDTVRGAAGGAEHKPRGAGGVWLWAGLGGAAIFSLHCSVCWRHPQCPASCDAQRGSHIVDNSVAFQNKRLR